MRVSAERIVEPALGVSTSNWIAPPYNRWGFRNVDKVAFDVEAFPPNGIAMGAADDEHHIMPRRRHSPAAGRSRVTHPPPG